MVSGLSRRLVLVLVVVVQWMCRPYHLVRLSAIYISWTWSVSRGTKCFV